MLALLPLAAAQPSPEMLRRVNAATASEQRAVRLQPRSAEAYRALADAYINNKFLRAASEALATAVEISPSSASWHLELGTLLNRVGDTEGARRHTETSLRLQPSAAAHLRLSYMAITPEAREFSVRAAIKLEPSSAEAYLRLARLMNEAQRGAEADAAFRTLAEHVMCRSNRRSLAWYC
jgi:Tfp pilus assembly protein PilF